MGTGVARPREVLELVGPEDAVSSDQSVCAGEPSVELAGVDEQQDQREQGPDGEAGQQRHLDGRDSRPSLRHGGQDYPRSPRRVPRGLGRYRGRPATWPGARDPSQPAVTWSIRLTGAM